MNLDDVMADSGILDDTNKDGAAGDTTILDDELLADELAGIVELTAAFLAFVHGPGLASDFARFTCGIYSLDELRADLWRLGAWIRGNA